MFTTETQRHGEEEPSSCCREAVLTFLAESLISGLIPLGFSVSPYLWG